MKYMCDLSMKGDQSIPWMIGGDMNLDAATMLQKSRVFLPKNIHPVLATSEWPQDLDAQKADIALCPTLDLIQVTSWIGKHSEPCVSDVHDAVVVMGHYRFPSHAAAPQLLVAEAPLDFAQPVCAAVEEVSASKDAQPAPPPPLTLPPCDSEVLVAGEVSANTSGVVHPPGLPLTTLKKRIPLEDIEETLGAIFETAACENDDIWQLAAEDIL